MKTARQLAARKAARRVRYKHRGHLYEIGRQIKQAKRKAIKLRKKADVLGKVAARIRKLAGITKGI